jgi:hypothetical protein
MRRSTLTIVGYLLIVFVSGVFVGAYGYRFVSPVAASAARKPSPEEWRKQYLKEMESRLKLTPDQLQHLNATLDETQARYHNAREQHNQVMKTIKEQQMNKIRAMLTDVQRPEYEKLRAEREARAKAATARP